MPVSHNSSRSRRTAGAGRAAACLLLPILALIACRNTPPEQPSKVAEAAPPPAPAFLPAAAAPVSREADDTARFLAGMPSKPGSAFADLENEDAWKKHRQELDTAWDKVTANLLTAMRQFGASELGTASVRNSIVFYPFSGPDTLTITTFFRHNSNYVMAALEPTGTLPTPAQFAGRKLDAVLTPLRETVFSELHRSFFITREMDRQFRGQVTDGLLPPILHLLVRTNCTILGYQYVGIENDGSVTVRPAGAKPPGRHPNRGMEIDFRMDDDGSLHRLFYFSVNLQDDRLHDNVPFLELVKKLQGAASFFKATSYMAHKPEFSVIRDATLATSGLILQDDSGIPYRFFSSPPWRVQLYGEYTEPYGSFRYMADKDLRAAYAAPGVKPLAFRIGYGFGAVPSNLLLATKQGAN